MSEANVKKSRYNKNDIIRYAVMALCAVIFIVCIVELLGIFAEYRESDKHYNDINQAFEYSPLNAANGFTIVPMVGNASAAPLASYQSQKNNPGAIHISNSGDYNVSTGNAEFQRDLAMLNSLYGQNSDTFGYIRIDDTKINYPIMQGPDNDYYLQRGFNKKYLKVGSIFADYRNSRSITENKNIIIFGHNMLNGSMFHDLARLDRDLHRDADQYLREHDEIRISSFDGIYIFKIFAFYHTTDEDPYLVTNFFSDAAFLSYCNTAIEKSMHDTGITVGADDIILTLSTCVNGKPTERYACHAKLVEIKK